MSDREDPLVAFKFGLEIEGKLSGYFTSVTGIGSQSQVVSHNITTETGVDLVQQIPGRLTWGEITLKRGVTSSLDIWNWRQLVTDGKVKEARTNCSIIAYDQESTEIARWNLENAWPSKVVGPAMDSSSTSYMMEDVNIVHEGVVRVS